MESPWGPEVHEWVDHYQKGEVLFKDGNLLSAWSSLQGRLGALKKINGFSPMGLKSPYLKAHYIMTVLSDLRPGDENSKVPFVIFLPGIFNGADEAASLRGMRRYAKLGYRVIAIPNPWSANYIGQQSRFSPGDIEHEAWVVLDMIAQIRQLFKSHMSSLDLVGESYGAFLGSVVTAIDASLPVPMIDGKTTLISPPIRINRAMMRLDDLIDQSKAAYYGRCKANLLDVILSLLTAQRESDLDPKVKFCGNSLVAYLGFQEGLRRSAEALNEVKHLGIVPDRGDVFSYKSWLKKLRFRNFLKVFSPDVSLDESDRCNLLYWLSIAQKKGNSRFRILTAHDDLLNNPDDWKNQNYVQLSDSNFIELPWGGHLGFAGLSHYQGFLKAAFKDGTIIKAWPRP